MKFAYGVASSRQEEHQGLLALRHKTVSHNTNDFKVFPVFCFGRHGGHKIPQLTLLKLFNVCTICLFTSWKYMI